MKNHAAVESLNKVLANTYALYLKTQNAHWHVKGPSFYALHNLFEEQYTALASAIDAIAERVVIVGGQAVASFKELQALNQVEDGLGQGDPKAILESLSQAHTQLLEVIQEALDSTPDQGTEDLLSERLGEHEKMRWMLQASV